MKTLHLHPPLGRHSRGYLPHQEIGAGIQGITFHLCGSLPAVKIHEWAEQLARLPEDESSLRIRKLIHDYLDQAHGKCHHARPEIARMVENARGFFNEQRYLPRM